ncbi:MAG: 4-hydroxy-2-oxovalerate aldolase [Pyrinomonadaceae bacterium]
MATPKLLECTLRDGSYVNNFQFTAADTERIASELDRLGFPLIETGHGIGLGASEAHKWLAAETDEAYMKATAKAVKRGKWGMFCIPGIAKLGHLDAAIANGMGFVRVGTNIEDYKSVQPFIEKAKKAGMLVCANFMKSYCSPPVEFAKYVIEAEKFGADIVYLVDSAGGMLPNEIRAYFAAVRETSSTVRLGFHGHDNLGLGVANSLLAIESGAEVVDTSLQGYGRSAGNTPTERLLGALMRAGYDLGIDPIAVMDAGEALIVPLILSRGTSSIDTVSGLAQFHSSYMPIIEEIAVEKRVDPRRLIVAVCARDRANAPRSVVREEADHLVQLGVKGNWRSIYAHYYGGEQE